NDGSCDCSLQLLSEAAIDPRIKVLSFARNFGHQTAITAGMDFAEGDAVVVMDADLQDPPEILHEMITQYYRGFDVVSAQRLTRQGETVFKRTSARLFYWLMRNMVDARLIPEVGDFRLFSGQAILALRSLREQHRFMRGMVAWLGLRETIVPFHRKHRVCGETKYPLYKMLTFAWVAISSFSALPLKITMLMGLALCLAGFAYLGYALFGVLVLKNVVQGWASIVALQCMFSGVTLLSLGVTGDYIGKIYEESKGRPLYVINRTFNVGPQTRPVPRGLRVEGCNERRSAAN
ncbi:MAG: hypothetical protein JWO80_1412, partial [Bryobacterales bacterium]|nr:hypothetical protein [Bryobacterales bacterium]